MIIWTQSRDKIGGSTNSTFLALIPKERNPSSIKKHRTICLCNSCYKILTKIISNRLKKVIPLIISENQGGFIAGRKIYNNILLVQEVIHSSQALKEAGMAIKLDLANAFDRVRHSFLFKVMDKFGFPPTFVRWVKAYIEIPWVSPLINGRPTNFFHAKRGIWKGYPMSPFLYILIVDALSRRLNRLKKKGSYLESPSLEE